MDKEALIIRPFLTSINGDDGAVLDLAGQWCFSKDLFAEGVHFLPGWLSPEQIGAKAMLVNISDAIVMNASPRYALLGLALPRSISHGEIAGLQRGLLKTAKSWGIQIIGGDTVGADKISISITLISALLGTPVRRLGLGEGHLLAFTGRLGRAAAGLEILKKGGRLSPSHPFIRPKLRAKFFYELAPLLSVAMDISDGLGKDLARLLEANKMGITWMHRPSAAELAGGEDYELLFGFDPARLSSVAALAKKHRVKITLIGRAGPIEKVGKYEFTGGRHHF